MTTREFVKTLDNKTQVKVDAKATGFSKYAQEMIFQETGVGYWQKGFWDACLSMALNEFGIADPSN